MKVLVIGDPHFRDNKTVMMENICNEIIDIINDKKPNLVICLGDVLHNHYKIDINPLCQSSKFFFRIAEIVPLVILSGNHDRVNNSDYMSDISSLYPLSKTPNIRIVNKVFWDRDRNFIYVPYVPVGMFRKALLDVGYDPEMDNDIEPLCIFAHQEFTNAKANGRVSNCSEGWCDKWPLIITGHFHDYHWVSSSLLYSGSLYQESYKEDSDKALVMVNFVNNKITEQNIERIILKSVVKKVEFNINIEDLDDIPSLVKKFPENHLIKIKLHLNPLQSSTVQKNVGYERLKNIVDKIDIIPDIKYVTEIDKTINKLNKEGNLTLENVTRNMLKDDKYVLNIFDSIYI